MECMKNPADSAYCELRAAAVTADAFFSGAGEFPGISFGVTLLGTLEAIPVDEYFSCATFEGYTAAEIVGHLAYAKWFLLEQLEPGAGGDYPFPVGLEGFVRGWESGVGTKSAQIDYIASVHGAAMERVRALRSNDYPRRIAQWKMSAFEACLWFCQHDIYHLAQIRNMGLPSLKRGHVLDRVNFSY